MKDDDSSLYVDAYNLILEWKVEEFQMRNKRYPDDFEISYIEQGLSECDIRSAMDYLRNDYEI